MCALYYYSNTYSMLVVGTSNRTEREIGYFTKHGDGAADILPIGALLKREVYELAAYLDVPDNVMKKEPSAGLWAGQTDEGELGISYDLLDSYLAGETVPPDVSERIDEMRRAAKHKLMVAPVFEPK